MIQNMGIELGFFWDISNVIRRKGFDEKRQKPYYFAIEYQLASMYTKTV